MDSNNDRNSRGGGRGRFFRGRFNWYNKRGGRGRGNKSSNNNNPDVSHRPEFDPEEGLRNRSNDCEDDIPDIEREKVNKRKRNNENASRRKKPAKKHNNDPLDSDLDTSRQLSIDTALRSQWGLKYPGYELYFPKDPTIVRMTEKLDAVREYLMRTGLDNESRISEVEEKECFDVNYSDLVKDDDLCQAWPEFSTELNENPKDVVNLWGLGLHGIVSDAMNKVEIQATVEEDKEKIMVPYIRFGIMRGDPVTPLKAIKASLLGKFITIRGAIVRTGIVKSYCTRQTFRCCRCRGILVLEQPDGTYTLPKICSVNDDCGNKNEFEPVLGASTTKVIDYRRIRIQDVENSHMEQGRIPRAIDCDLFYDLVNNCNAGAIITLSGIVKMSKESRGPGSDQSLHNLYVEVLGLKNHKDSERTMGGHWFAFTNKDYYAVKEIFETEKLFRLLVSSLCPSIFGMDLVKAGILLALFAGTQHNYEMIDRRSDINVLVVGDPGLGKSQMLKMVSEVAPRGVYICGTGSTTAGLTVTLVREGEDYSLEAGALVMADKGVCCIDEFDKMQAQHNALLEAMEQQSVSIAKAGVFRTIPARTSVLAAANPVGGHYDNSRSVSENIRISAPLLSRFDLTFILQDKPDEVHDKNMVRHIFGRPSSQGEQEGNGERNTVGSTPSQIRPDSLLDRLMFLPNEKIDLIPRHLLRKYIAYAKQYVHPKMSREAAQIIKEQYLNLRRNHRHIDSTPVTTRQLESLMRLTEARAKAELREVATEEDAKDILEIFEYSMRGVYENDKDVTLGFTPDLMETTIQSAMLTPSAKRSLSKNLGKRLAKELERASSHENKHLFTVDEITRIAHRVQIDSASVGKLIDTLNNGGLLLKKGPRLYQFTSAD